MPLATITHRTKEILDSDKSFLMMVEEVRIDWYCRQNNITPNVHEVIPFDDTVAVDYNFYLKHTDEEYLIKNKIQYFGDSHISFVQASHYQPGSRWSCQHVCASKGNRCMAR